jgi:TonB family protein
MRGSPTAILVWVSMCASLSPLALAQGKSGASAADELRTAQLAWGSDPAKRCPELHQSSAEEGAVAVVKLKVGPTGVPSQPSIASSSGSAGFDAAAVACMPKLRFLPATRYGDGTAVESWQQFALKWTGVVRVPQAARCEAAGASQGTESAQAAAVVTEPSAGSGGQRDQPGPTMARSGICVCVDETGKIAQTPVLTNSSGLPGFDKAALELSAAAHYRPPLSATGQPAAGCFRFKVGIEVK